MKARDSLQNHERAILGGSVRAERGGRVRGSRTDRLAAGSGRMDREKGREYRDRSKNSGKGRRAEVGCSPFCPHMQAREKDLWAHFCSIVRGQKNL